MTIKPEIWWCMKYENNLRLELAARSKVLVQGKVEGLYDQDWEVLEADGYKIVKIEVREVEE